MLSLKPAQPFKRSHIQKKLTEITKNIDNKLCLLWQNMPILSQCGCVLVAVGGYGRQEMYPHSDIDLLIVVPENTQYYLDGLDVLDCLNNEISLFFQKCWDNQLNISHSVRNLSECLTEAANDITVQTALLEARLIIGNSSLFLSVVQQCIKQLNITDFFQAKLLEMQQRHQRYEHTAYSLEPNCKESPGGLRDLHLLIWIAKAMGLTALKNNSRQTWKDLKDHQVLNSIEAKTLIRAEKILQNIRYALHILSKRREDRLVFDLQTAVADLLGYTAKPGRRVSEVLMQTYYLAAKTVLQLNNLLLQALERQMLGESSYHRYYLTDDYCEEHGFLHVLNVELFNIKPIEILNVFHLLVEQAHLRDLSASTQRALWNTKKNLLTINDTNEFKQSFMRFFERGTGLTQTFRRMNSLGILGYCISDFKRIIGQMQHDLFHIYTVDQHILMVLRNMRRFLTPQHVHEYSLCSQLIRSFKEKPVLYIAAMFHDIAKGRGGDHSLLGEQAVKRFGLKMNLSKEHIQLAMFLVKHHLILSTVAQKSDLSDANIIIKFARLVKNEERLTGLYLLTVADIRGTSPKIWSIWKAKLIETLYTKTLYQLNNNKHKQNRQKISSYTLTHQAQTLVLNLLPKNIQTEPVWRYLDDTYFLRNTPNDAAWHTSVLLTQINEPITVASRLAPDKTGLQIMVYSKDQNKLFVRLCSCFDQQSFSVLTAQVYTTRHGYALDHFLLRFSDSEYEFPKYEINCDDELKVLLIRQLKLESAIKNSLMHLPELPPPKTQRIPRQARQFFFEPQIYLVPNEKNGLFLLELHAVDQVSLLYRVAHIFAKYEISIHTARITTLGSRVEDFFLISGSSLDDEKIQIQLETDLLKAVEIK
jgi:[protein-PII] uridylyltransferase